MITEVMLEVKSNPSTAGYNDTMLVSIGGHLRFACDCSGGPNHRQPLRQGGFGVRISSSFKAGSRHIAGSKYKDVLNDWNKLFNKEGCCNNCGMDWSDWNRYLSYKFCPNCGFKLNIS